MTSLLEHRDGSIRTFQHFSYVSSSFPQSLPARRMLNTISSLCFASIVYVITIMAMTTGERLQVAIHQYQNAKTSDID